MSPLPNVQELGTNVSGAPGPDRERHVHIVLLGLMGSGKSTVGRLVANELGRPFVDSDSIVELRTGHLPPEVVERGGVDELHEVELAALRQVVAQRDSVVYAAAASVVDVLTPGELDAAWCVWLDTSPSVLADRVRGDPHERPLLGDRPEQVLVGQHDRRAQRGREIAATSITTDDRTPVEVAARLCDAWREWSRRCRP
jgi:shikimate kinase